MSVAVTIIAVLHVVIHSVLCIVDYSQVVAQLDFITREDGSQSDPDNLLPLELIYAAITAMSFGTVGFAFFLAFFESSGVTMKGAAAISLFFHGLWFMHMVWRWDVWRAMMHPEGGLQPEFFYASHAIWSGLAVVVLVLPAPRKSKTS